MREAHGFSVLRNLAASVTAASLRNADHIKQRSEEMNEALELKIARRKAKKIKRKNNPGRPNVKKNRSNEKHETATVIFPEDRLSENESLQSSKSREIIVAETQSSPDLVRVEPKARVNSLKIIDKSEFKLDYQPTSSFLKLIPTKL